MSKYKHNERFIIHLTLQQLKPHTIMAQNNGRNISEAITEY